MEGKVAADGRPGGKPGVGASVGILADDQGTRERVADVLTREGLSVTVQAGAFEAFLRACAGRPPATVVVAGEPARDGRAAAVRQLRERLPGTSVVVTSPSSSGNGARAALRAGASGYVLESRLESALGVTVLAARAGQVSVPRELRPLVEKPALTQREKQVLATVVLGFSNQEIATKLHVAETTVKSHLSSAFKKLGVRTRKEAVATILDPNEGLGAGILSISPQG